MKKFAKPLMVAHPLCPQCGKRYAAVTKNKKYCSIRCGQLFRLKA